VTTQLAIPNKKTRFGPKVASRNWWIKKIKITQPKYTSYWTHYTKSPLSTGEREREGVVCRSQAGELYT
jgi:hypothetical protein